MKVVLAGPYPDGTLERFRVLMPEHIVVNISEQSEYDRLTDAECIVVRVLKTSDLIIQNNPKLRAVIRWGAGYDSVDIKAAGTRGVMVANTPGLNAYAVAELAVGMMIFLKRRVLDYQSGVRNGSWDRGAFPSYSVNRKTVGIIGGGNIGRRVAVLAQKLGAETLYYDAFRLPPEREELLEMKYTSLDELLKQSDIVTLHVPLLESTKHIIGASQLEKMKPTACLINTARGGLVDDAALLSALEEGRLAAAGLDCVEDEISPTTSRLAVLPNVILTPHIGGSTADLADEMIPDIVGKIRTLAAGGELENVVNRDFLVAGKTNKEKE